jgi:deazaflavin-dependent oxidoreductase (nitroreductase family)
VRKKRKNNLQEKEKRMTETGISPDLPSWIQDHLRRYLESEGEDGHMWDASSAGGSGVFPTLLLTTTGRRSGEPRMLPLIYGKTEGGYVIVASKGGFPQHPAWYLNLVAEPQVRLQVGAEKLSARARTAEADERSRLWDEMVTVYSPYSEYQTRAGREIPVVVLEPSGE